MSEWNISGADQGSESDDSSAVIEDDLLEELIEYRTRFYENLANDALKILNIQLLVLPISISVISLVITALTITADEDSESSALNVFANSIDQQLLYYGAFIAAGSVILTTFSYYFARKYSHSQTRFLFRARVPEIASKSPFEERENTVEDNVRKVSAEFLRRKGIANDQERIDQLTELLDNGHSSIRGALTVSLLGTLTSAALLTVSVASAVYPQIRLLTALIFVLAISLVSYFVLIGDSIIVSAQVAIFAQRFMGIFADVVGEVAVDIVENTYDILKSYPVIFMPFLLFLVTTPLVVRLGVSTGIFTAYIVISLLTVYIFGSLGALREWNPD